ncbi:MAG: DegT/DnrJ/EryC1/StrS aminotransferase family protein [Deltaproteobacteria bacterium]|jgi:dTDP-4-amino-4,6-dideoxygalactose transaminase|nr:DegT/DnrJ/EryC1/StrS aminotransferase family protein [Deltaproteobacteria bacterium]
MSATPEINSLLSADGRAAPASEAGGDRPALPGAGDVSELAAGLRPLGKFLPFSPPSVGELEARYLLEALESGWLTAGPRTEKFEGVMARHLGTSGALALSSCTAALHLGLKVMGLGPGQAVLTTPLTFVSTAHAAVYNGARPLLADVSPDTGNLDPGKVAEFLAGKCRVGPDGRPVHRETGLTITAMAPVHYGGHPVDLPGLWEIAEKFRLGMLEDAAHAVGTTWNGLPVGHPDLRPKSCSGLPSLCAFSFYATKNVAAGEGGLLTSSDPVLLDRARRLSAYGISDARRIWGRYAPRGTWDYDVAEVGFKCNFTDLQAALGLAQMERLGELQEKRARNAAVWTEALAPWRDYLELPATRPGAGHAWHLYPLRLRPENLKITRDQLVPALKALNVGTSVMFIPIHHHGCYRDIQTLGKGELAVAEDFFRREISLPVSPAHSPEAIGEAAEALVSLIRRHRR